MAATNPIRVRLGKAGRLIVLFRYRPERVAKIKTIAGRRWHPKENYWTVPQTDGAIAHLMAIFAGDAVEVEPSLRPLNAAMPGHDAYAAPRSEGWRRVVNGSMPAMAPNPRLLDRVCQAIRARHYSRSTEEAYLAWVKRFIRFNENRHPTEVSEPEVNRFLTHLAVDERVAASTQNQALAACCSCTTKC